MKIDCQKNQIRNRYFGIGMEKLDRDAFDPGQIYDEVAALGVKWVRIQSGWAKTEKEKGRYDFLWLDEIVDELNARGLTPWLCLCYGNPLYDGRAKKIAGGVGCPPLKEEALRAWLSYCQKVAFRYQNKIEYYEIWNEPDWLWTGTPDPGEYTAFCLETAKAIKEVAPVKVIVGSVASIDPGFMTTCIERGILDGADALSYHAYSYDEETFARLNGYYRSACAKKKEGIEIIHGECGSQSKNGGNGAYKGFRTNPMKQAKQLLRQMVTDRFTGAFFSSFFTATDMHENLMAKANKPIKKHGYFGVLQAFFNAEGIACAPFTPKPAYYAFQNVCALFGEDVIREEFPFWIDRKKDDVSLLGRLSNIFSAPIGSRWMDRRLNLLTTICLKRGEAKALVYWERTNLLRGRSFSSCASIRFYGCGAPRLVDLLTGEITEIEYEQKDGCVFIKKLPVKDYPLVVCFGDFI